MTANFFLMITIWWREKSFLSLMKHIRICALCSSTQYKANREHARSWSCILCRSLVGQCSALWSLSLPGDLTCKWGQFSCSRLLNGNLERKTPLTD
jgi:hypothetical protein